MSEEIKNQEGQELGIVYISHTCKNSKLDAKDPNYCFNAFVDEDRHGNNDIPPSWKYCPSCVKKGFLNPRRKKVSQAMLDHLAKMRQKAMEAKKNG